MAPDSAGSFSSAMAEVARLAAELDAAALAVAGAGVAQVLVAARVLDVVGEARRLGAVGRPVVAVLARARRWPDGRLEVGAAESAGLLTRLAGMLREVSDAEAETPAADRAGGAAPAVPTADAAPGAGRALSPEQAGTGATGTEPEQADGVLARGIAAAQPYLFLRAGNGGTGAAGAADLERWAREAEVRRRVQWRLEFGSDLDE